MLAKKINEPYSAIEHYAMNLGRSNWQKVWFSMLTACFDASGKEEDQPVLVVAGFISSAKDWKDFDSVWRKRLSQEGLDWFHAVDFFQGVGDFEPFKRDKRRKEKLLADLVDIIKSHVYRKFGSIVVINDFLNLSRDLRTKFSFTAYVLAGRTVAKKISDWCSEAHISNPVSLIFEEGDIGKGKLIARLTKDGYPTPEFRWKKDQQTPLGLMPGYTPLQAADLYAYELFLAAKRLETGKLKYPNLRWAFKEFESTQGEPGFYSAESINALQKKLLLPQKLEDWRNSLRGNTENE